MPQKLFEEFEPVSSKQWKQQIQFELKGADYNELIWTSPEGIKVKPFYHSDDDLEKHAVSTPENPFTICQDIYVKDVEKSAYRAKDSLSRGADSIRFTLADDQVDLNRLLGNLPLDNKTVYLNLSFISEPICLAAAKIAKEQNATIYCCIDPVGHLAKEGNWMNTPGKTNFDALNSILEKVPNLPLLSCNAGLYQNAGANIVQQIAYSMAHANEYLNRIPNISSPMVFQVAVGANYFFEIAKLRAMRLLFDTIAAEYGHTAGCHIIATPSKRNKTLYDYNVNMLRTTTECMSAILGGADSVANLPYDALYHKSNEFGERISRNQLLVLKHESYFDKVGNAAEGSYYIENLTHQLASKALALFKDIEANGGLIFQFGEGTIQRKIAESATREQQLFDNGTEVLLGTNRHPNKNDRMAAELELFPFVKTNPRKTLVAPIIEKRLAEQVEQQRLSDEKPNGTEEAEQ